MSATLAGAATPGYSATLSGTVNRLNHVFESGKYRFLVHNTAEHITLSGTTATVATAPAPAGATGTFVHNAPGWLFFAAKEVTIAKETDCAVTVAMQQQVGELTLIIEPTGGTVDKIERIEGILTGVASTLDMVTGTPTEPQNAELRFSEITDGADAGKWSATVRLLGLAGAQQRLDATIRFRDGSPAPVDLTSDLTAALTTFNADKRKPLTLSGSVVETPTGAGVVTTIIDWTPGNEDGENVDANT